jgi:hypothetical protein
MQPLNSAKKVNPFEQMAKNNLSLSTKAQRSFLIL